MAIGISANIASVNGQSNLYKNDNKSDSKINNQNSKGAYNVDVNDKNSFTGNVQYANSNASIAEIRADRLDKQDKLGVDFEKDSQNFDKGFILQKDGAFSSIQGNISKEAALSLI